MKYYFVMDKEHVFFIHSSIDGHLPPGPSYRK